LAPYKCCEHIYCNTLLQQLAMDDRFGEDVCVVYQKVFRTESGEKAVSVQEGRERLRLCSTQRGNHELTKYLMSDPLSVHVHESCRKQYVNVPVQQVKRPAVTDGVQETGKVKVMRSCVDTFDWKRCILCGKLAVRDERRPAACTECVRRRKTRLWKVCYVCVRNARITGHLR